MLTEPSDRGWSSNRPVKTFEDCVIFVLVMEKGLSRVSALDSLLLTRIVLQEYSVAETALMLNKSHRMIGIRLCDALDRLTGISSSTTARSRSRAAAVANYWTWIWTTDTYAHPGRNRLAHRMGISL